MSAKLSARSAAPRRGPGSRADENHPTRRELLDAAAALADEEGLKALSVSRVTAAAGHAKGTFYVHFPDRASYLVALHRRFHDAVFSRIIDATAAEPPGPPRARRRLLAFLDSCRDLPSARALLLDARTEPAIAAEVTRRNRQATAVLAADLAGCCAQPRETARFVVLAAADVAARESDRGRRLPSARQALLELVSCNMSPHPEPRPPRR